MEKTSKINLLRTLSEQQRYHDLLHMSIGIEELAILPLQALAHANLGNDIEAKEFYLQTLAIHNKLDIDALVDLAAVNIVMKQVTKAVALLEDILKEQPQHSLALARLGYCYLLQDDSQTALKLYQQSVQINPNRLSLLHNLIPLYIKQSKLDDATTSLAMAKGRLATIAKELPDSVWLRYSQQHNMFQLNIWVVNGNFSYAERWLRLKEWREDYINNEEII
ncbi:MAG: tetratricopeptide repeat protein, partial [Magnetococcales bacterium]|nr:tetratricopeptide repeat protein [Magnetococcales bacterium]